ncbi:(Fe-S)-binding protein [Vibrio penaeicida]|uniref:4Fe-4S ferredoxin n=1 Tax=Vibrio penaeicida TaxID=104609 RepID=A0AAV5NY48_9VIBR|nr:(Fe-S)-binding protein [Vibrio penaeicida]RTZ22685.1 DUF3483 domain-containing protein [Vibrio penaeicida]GLQ75645.1 4Fe-4S ferredoxin [Vibrio penaeicida]
MINQILPWLLVTVILVWVLGALRRILMWRRGRKEPVNVVAGLLSIPKRYLVDLHHVVARDKYMSNTHVAAAGGFVASLLGLMAIYLFDLDYHPVAWAVLILPLLAMFVGAIFVYLRRVNAPPNLSKGAWMRLPKSLLMFSASGLAICVFTLASQDSVVGNTVLAVVLLLGIALGLLELVVGMTWGGPLKHAFSGALHLAFHRRAERFSGIRSTGLKPIDIKEPAPGFGVAKPEDFSWKQLLSFDACVQCGRCEKMCPAFAAGQPLNPKKMIQDLVVGMAGGDTSRYAGQGYPGKEGDIGEGGKDQPLFEKLLDPETVWSCTTCRACVEECPMMIEHVDAMVDMRRHLTLDLGQTPGKGREVLENLIATDNPNGLPPVQRHNWGIDLKLPVLKEVKECDVLFWVGDAAFDMRNQRTIRAVVKLLRRAGVSFAVLGNEELDSGDLARRLGDEATFQRLAKANIGVLNKYRFKAIVTADPHAFHVLKNEYPDFGGNFEVEHHTQLLARLVESGSLHLDSDVSKGTVTYHDPCYLGRYNEEYEAPRYLLKQLGFELKEMERSGYRSRCCGGGGGAPVTDIPGEKRIPDIRMKDIKETQADVVAVGCPQCTLMLEGVVEPRPDVKDIAELLLEALPAEKAQPAATVSAREVA